MQDTNYRNGPSSTQSFIINKAIEVKPGKTKYETFLAISPKKNSSKCYFKIKWNKIGRAHV